jgi:CRP-like cAMP-binding protein
MEKLIRFIERYIKIDADKVSTINSYFHLETFRKGDIIMEGKGLCDKLYFINSGYVRTYYFDEGKEVTSWIYPPNGFFTIWSSLYVSLPMVEYSEALTDVEVAYIEKKDLESFYNTYDFNEFGRRMLQEEIAGVDLLSRQMSFLTAKEKYNFIFQNFPYMIKEAKLSHIASIVGITQETLSRIRGK